MALYFPFFVSLLIGLLIGLEREKSSGPAQKMGIRTFSLIALLGSLSGWTEENWIGVALSAFALSLILISYYHSSKPEHQNSDRGTTTEVAAAVVFFLGYASHTSLALVSLLGSIVALLLFLKEPLHRFSKIVRPAELQAAIILLLLGVSVVSLLEDKVVDPWNLINPKKIGMLVLALSALEFVSYIAVKVLGTKRSPWIIGLLGGLVSSTAVLLFTAKRAKEHPNASRVYLATALIAKIASFFELFVIIAVLAPDLGAKVAVLMAPSFVIGLSLAFLIGWKQPSSTASLELSSPLDFRGVLRISLLLTSVIALVALAQRYLGNIGTLAISFLSGLFELHGVVLATANVYSAGRLSSETAMLSLCMAVLASLFSKIALSWIVDRAKFARAITFLFTLLAISTGLGLWLTRTLIR